MERFGEYCAALGVRPGDTAETVKRAFRSRIKDLHPDVAGAKRDERKTRFLIEAYEAFKKGVPIPQTPPTFRRPAAEQGVPMDAYQRGNEAGREAFHRAMSGAGFLKDVFVNLSGKIYVEDEWEEEAPLRDRVGASHSTRRGSRIDPENTPFVEPDPELRGGATSTATPHTEAAYEGGPALDQARSFFHRAETALRDTVQHFEARGNRFRKQWSRDYIAELVRIQVLYRDVSRRFPIFSIRSLARVRQINELIGEIRKAAR